MRCGTQRIVFVCTEQKENGTSFRMSRGARGGSRTRTPLRALAPEASESTNSTTRAFGSGALLLSARCILPQGILDVNSFLAKKRKIFRRAEQGENQPPQRFALWGLAYCSGRISPQRRPAFRCPVLRRTAGREPALWRWSSRRRAHRTRCSGAAGDHAGSCAAGTSRCRGRRPG